MLFVVLREKESEYFVVYLSRFKSSFSLGGFHQREIFFAFFFCFFFLRPKNIINTKKSLSPCLSLSLSLSLSRGRCNLFAQSALPPAAALARARGS